MSFEFSKINRYFFLVGGSNRLLKSTSLLAHISKIKKNVNERKRVKKY
jgi:hypothetical protein